MQPGREQLVYEVTRRHRRGESIRGICRALGLARKTVRRILRDLEQRREQGDAPTGATSTRAPRASNVIGRRKVA